MNSEGWHALVAIILALGAAVAVIVLAVSVLLTRGHITVEEATLLSTVLGVMVGATAAYLGARAASSSGGSDENPS